MSKIKKIQLAALLDVSRAAITKAEKAGLIKVVDSKIDMDDPVNKYYAASRGVVVSKQEVEKAMTKKNPSDKEIKKIQKKSISSEELAEFIARKKKADAEYAELKNKKMRGELLDAELVHDMLFLFLDKVTNGMQRNASAYLSDIADSITKEGGLSAAARKQWQKIVLDEFEAAKKEILIRIDKIKEVQNG